MFAREEGLRARPACASTANPLSPVPARRYASSYRTASIEVGKPVSRAPTGPSSSNDVPRRLAPRPGILPGSRQPTIASPTVPLPRRELDAGEARTLSFTKNRAGKGVRGAQGQSVRRSLALAQPSSWLLRDPPPAWGQGALALRQALVAAEPVAAASISPSGRRVNFPGRNSGKRS